MDPGRPRHQRCLVCWQRVLDGSAPRWRRQHAPTVLARSTAALSLADGGIVVATASGAALVFASPMNWFANVIFWTKMASMGVAGLNAFAFHFVTEPTL